MKKTILLDPPSKESLAAFCNILYERHLATGVGGNVSVRVGNKFLVTPSGISLRDITPELILAVGSDGSISHGSNPSKDFTMHRYIFKERDDVKAVCHVHGGHIVAASTILKTGPNSLPPLTPGFTCLAYPLPMLPFFVPGSFELAEAVGECFANRKLRALLLKNHGLITVGNNMTEALNIAEEVEEASQVYVLTSGRGNKIDEDLIPMIS